MSRRDSRQRLARSRTKIHGKSASGVGTLTPVTRPVSLAYREMSSKPANYEGVRSHKFNPQHILQL